MTHDYLRNRFDCYYACTVYTDWSQKYLAYGFEHWHASR